ncbi:CHASE2 domain-containing protein [Leptolyngbya cf. ectocarpi LEGE 11479]|uniref:CHASE2 domain-containing protein n=1 Tax=Leptolyngbya cf. ectocarpi LEGE 11479 TaxID=1828722 RepID=A0A929F6Y3_LEPEC|nr:CHASE2 domain-containing protein [Leptolyngbya ectocarpi]MBE9067926.1 CHASE2 domain-containing protein [Leptolyngbya cf. ectocarpi LEGE 11479]
MAPTYRLAVNQISHTCFFELTWGQGQQLMAQLPYPDQLTVLHQRWQRAYLGYYQSAFGADLAADCGSDLGSGQPPLRGRAGVTGQISPARTDWHSQLVQAEAKLLSEFHRWLRSEPLFSIRCQLGKAATAEPNNPQAITLFITCTPIHLARLPWESWEVTAEFNQHQPICIARLPANIRTAATPPQRHRRRARVLVIIGDETGLDLSGDLQAIDTLSSLADIHQVGWRPGLNGAELAQTICNKISDPDGWDMLFFFGHSNEADSVGGEIAIAPHTNLSLRELGPYVQQAQQNGLQFALFNSCKGLDIAESLVDLGLNQVVVMREPIHNQVAQAFLTQFLRRLAQFDDVHRALLKASQSLRSESTLTYPSAHLVPSLFSHRGAELFRLQPVGWKAWLDPWLPSIKQGVVLGAIALLACTPSIRDQLLSQRLYTQSVYRQITQQIPNPSSPPVLLVQIDDKAVSEIDEFTPYQMDWSYIAQLIDILSAGESPVIGIDYLFDRRQDDNQPILRQSLETAADRGSLLVLGSVLTRGEEVGPRPGVADLAWSMQGYANAPWNYLQPPATSCQTRCPFAYLVALARASGNAVTSPANNNAADLKTELLSIQQPHNPALTRLSQLRRSPWSRLFKQRWFQPILDFSIPTDRVYQSLSSSELLEPLHQSIWKDQVVLIGAGGYGGAGLGDTQDYTEPPPAVTYWHRQRTHPPARFTGTEAHAYAVHHFLQRHQIIPIPSLLLIGVASFLGAGSVIVAKRYDWSPQQRWLGLMLWSTAYGFIGLQAHITVSVVLPWLLPTATVWLYHLPGLQRSRSRPQ